MLLSRYFLPILRETPKEAEIVSHRLMLRAGMMRQEAAGIYAFLPLGLRVLDKICRIVREEQNRSGAIELLMPTIQSADLWRESGRYEDYGKEMLRIKDRHERDLLYGPTNEEMITEIFRSYVQSYKDLPLNLYHIQWKFRDEIRPRFGLMRGREFLMKDAYSFHADRADAEREYRHMYDTYTRIFERCGLTFRAVEAGTGTIGGTLSHEFQVLAESGEDAIVSCDHCGYAANVEKADTRALPPVDGGGGALERVATPGKRTVEEVSKFLGLPPERFVKTLIYQAPGGVTVAALVRGDHEVSSTKLSAAVDGAALQLADEATVRQVTGASVGFAGPVGVRVKHIVADGSLRGSRGAVSGANRDDEHLVNIDLQRDVQSVTFADLRQARPGDRCARCEEGTLGGHRGIEVGQVFYLGTKYSTAMGATVLDAQGVQRPIEMGCYGIGITRTVAAAIEQHHDDAGIVWPAPLAPYGAVVVPVSMADATLRETAERVTADLETAGIDTLLDDRDERPGVKFKDADLVGLPVRVTVGPRALARGNVELKRRADAQPTEVPIAEAAKKAAAMVGPR